MSAVLLDTHAAVWMVEDTPSLRPAARKALEAAAAAGGLLVSPVSAWEIGMLARGGRVRFGPDAQRWFAALMAAPGVVPAPFTAAIAIAASFLPPPLHGDPADRLLIATALAHGVPIVTRDRKILAYAEAGHVTAIAC